MTYVPLTALRLPGTFRGLAPSPHPLPQTPVNRPLFRNLFGRVAADKERREADTNPIYLLCAADS